MGDWSSQQEAIDEFDALGDEDCLDDPLEICDIPQCADFCVDHDVKVSFKFDISKFSVDAFYEHEPGSEDATDRTIYIGGDAGVVLERYIPDFPHEADGSVEISGSADVSSSHFRGNGGIIIGHCLQTITSFTNWKYTGGVWPFHLTDKQPYVAESIPLIIDGDNTYEGEQPWYDPENAFRPDGSYARTEVSWNGISQFLLCRDFRLHIPLVGPRDQAVKVERIQVQVNRWTTQVGTEDLNFFLVYGNEVISNNVEQTSFRWPLIPTTITYGDNPSRFEPNQNRFRNQDELLWNPWDVDVLNSPDFGVAIQIHDVVNAGATFGYIDSVSLEVQYDYVEHQTLRVGGSARQVSSAYTYVADGFVEIGGSAGLHVGRAYLPNGIGLGQPTSVVFGGNHATAKEYIVSDQNTVWWDAGNPVVEENTGEVAYWMTEGTHQPLSDFLGGADATLAEWEDSSNAAVGDTNYAYVDISPDVLDSDFLVVRNLGLDLDGHWKIHGLRVFVGTRGTRTSEDDPTTVPETGSGATVGGHALLDEVGGVKVSGVAHETFEDVTNVRDRYVYLVRGDTIVSDNLAKDEPWPAYPGYDVAIYGSTGFDDEQQFRDLDLTPWDTEEINDPEFGVAIAVSNLGVTVDTLAEIDGIAVELTIEAWGRVETLQSHVRLIGSSVAYSDHAPGRGGTTAGGEAEVKPFWDVVGGGIFVGETMPVQQHFFYDVSADGTDDGIVMGGGVLATTTNLKQVASGGVELSGPAITKCSHHKFESDGNAIFIGGGAYIKATTVGSAKISLQAGMQILEVKGIFSDDDDGEIIESLTDDVSQCGCASIPLIIVFQHNMVRDNILAQFLARNGFSMSDTLDLYYNVPNNSWQSNLHYHGLAADANVEEKWDFVFEVQCTDEMGGIEIGRSIWKLSLSIFRENLSTGEDFDTRVVMAVMPDAICPVESSELEFKVSFDTQSDLASVSPEDAVVYQSTIFDNIGLFKNRSWIAYPELVLSVAQSGFRAPQGRTDLYDAILPREEAGALPSS
jgi:hypothetical protein